jgi:hypothetical protein
MRKIKNEKKSYFYSKKKKIITKILKYQTK